VLCACCASLLAGPRIARSQRTRRERSDCDEHRKHDHQNTEWLIHENLLEQVSGVAGYDVRGHCALRPTRAGERTPLPLHNVEMNGTLELRKMRRKG
jgi:hypothetical protein